MQKDDGRYEMDPNRSSNIPEEILFISLAMLPVKSLSRFRCVSKHWFSMITNPNFEAAQLAHYKTRPKFLISITRERLWHEANDDKMNFYSVEYPEDNHESPNLHVIAHASVDASPYTQVNSTTGLICCTCSQGIKIVNPITGEFNLIQYPNSDNFFVRSRSYLGFDPIDKKLAISLIQKFCHAPMKCSVFPLQESKWHYTTPPPPRPLYEFGKSIICVNGVIYFTSKFSDYREPLYAFDVRSESFELIQYPPYPFFVVENLFDYKGRVALHCSKDYIVDSVDWHSHPSMNETMVWILEDPKKHIWRCKSFAIPWGDNILGSGAKFFGATQKGELIFASREGSLQLFLYEIDTDTLRRFQVNGIGATSSSIVEVRVDFLIESLYSPRRSN